MHEIGAVLLYPDDPLHIHAPCILLGIAKMERNNQSRLKVWTR